MDAFERHLRNHGGNRKDKGCRYCRKQSKQHRQVMQAGVATALLHDLGELNLLRGEAGPDYVGDGDAITEKQVLTQLLTALLGRAPSQPEILDATAH